jgi:tetratricopeptide (TPR) repeat protein
MIALALITATAAGLAPAPPALAVDDEAEGRRRFRRGEELYKQERYLEAAREFEAGYESAPRPLFLLNIGHSYRLAREFVKAKKAYELLLRLEPGLPQRAEVEGLIRTIDDALAAGGQTGSGRETTRRRDADAPPPVPPAPVSPVATASEPEPPPDLSPRRRMPAPAFAETEATTTDEPGGPAQPIYKKPWFWAAAGAVVVAAGVGLFFALRTTESCPGTVCFKETP